MTINNKNWYPVLLIILVYHGYLSVINSAALPYIAEDFGLESGKLSQIMGWISFGAFGTLMIARYIDILGRFTLLKALFAVSAIFALISAIANNLYTFTLAQIIVTCVSGGLLTIGTVTISEQLPPSQRVKGQSWVGIAVLLGAGIAYTVISVFSRTGEAWRLAWGLAAVPIILLPFFRFSVKETPYSEKSTLNIKHQWQELFQAPYLRHTLVLCISILLGSVFLIAATSWQFFYQVHELGMSQQAATAIVLGAGIGGFLGFPLANYCIDYFGRRACFLILGILLKIIYIIFYLIPDHININMYWGLFTCNLLGMIFINAFGVTMRTWTTELFPFHLRATIQGALGTVNAIAGIMSFFVISIFITFFGSLHAAIIILGLISLPSGLLAYYMLPETKGIELKQSLQNEF